MSTNYIDIAIEEAKKSNMRCKHGCVIVYKKKIVAKGHNCYIPNCTHTVHAEISALKKLRKNASNISSHKMYVVRISREKDCNNITTISKPCENCSKSIQKAGIKKIYYTI